MSTPGATFTTSQHTTYAGRVGNALKGVCVGLVLFILSFPLLVWNERNFVNQAAALDEVSQQVQSVDPADPLSSLLTNKAVHVSGALELGEVRDDEYGISVRALRLTRRPESYQYIEHKSTRTEKDGRGGEREVSTYSYTRDWSRELQASLADPTYAGKNPRGWIVPPHTVVGSATLGPYRLPEAVTRELGRETPLDPLNPTVSEIGRAIADAAAEEDGAASGRGRKRGGVAALPAPGKTLGHQLALSTSPSTPSKSGAVTVRSGSKSSTFSRELLAMTPSHGYLYTGNPSKPSVGDNRVQWSAAAPETASVVGRQTRDGTLAPIVASNGHKILLFGEGDQSVTELFNSAHDANAAMTWAIRAGGWLLMLVGLLAIFQPAAILVDIVPFIGGFLSSLVGGGLCVFAAAVATSLSLITIAISWFAFRPLIAVGLATAAAAIFYGLSLRKQRLQKASIRKED